MDPLDPRGQPPVSPPGEPGLQIHGEPGGLTEQEIYALLENHKMTPEILSTLSPREEAIVSKHYKEVVVPNAQAFSGLTSLAAGGAGVAGMLPKAAGSLLNIGGLVEGIANRAPGIGGVVGAGAGATKGHPYVGGIVGSKIGNMIKEAFGSKPGPPPPTPKPVTRITGPMSDRPGMFGEIAERVKKGVQNDFPPGFPKIVPRPERVTGPQQSIEELLENVLGTAREGRTPMRWHESAPEGARKSIDTLKRTVGRRNP